MSDEPVIFAPPFRTPCAPCQQYGHYCRATRFLRPNDPEDERGICESCATHQDCPTNAAIRASREDTSDAVHMPVGGPHGQGRSIPKEEWKPEDLTIKEQDHDITSVPFGMRTAVRDQMKEKPMASDSKTDTLQLKFLKDAFPTSATFLDSLSKFALNTVKYATSIAPETTWFIEEKVGEHWHMVIDHPIFFTDREQTRRAARTLSSTAPGKETRTMMWRKGFAAMTCKIPVPDATPVSRIEKGPTESTPDRKRGKGLFTHEGKKVAREEAKRLLLDGAKLIEVSASTGLSEKTVQDIRGELGLVKKQQPILERIPEPIKLTNMQPPQHTEVHAMPESKIEESKPAKRPLLSAGAYKEVMEDIQKRIDQLERIRRDLKELQGE